MDRLAAIVIDDLYLWVVDNEASALLFHFSVGDHLLSSGDDLRHERHVEPSASDFPGSEYPAGAVHDDGLVEACFAVALGACINHTPVQADRFAGRKGGESVELASIFVTFREMV